MVAVADFSQISAGLISAAPKDVKSKRISTRTRARPVTFLAVAASAAQSFALQEGQKARGEIPKISGSRPFSLRALAAADYGRMMKSGLARSPWKWTLKSARPLLVWISCATAITPLPIGLMRL